jgi:DNA-binding MarR family transcriptional regulator
MTLKEELKLKRGYKIPAHEALLNIYYTTSILKKRADAFFAEFGLTDVQYNLLALLDHQADKDGGLSQAQISDMMLVNRANITSLVDRMEKADLVKRTAHANDRRYNIVKLTAKGRKLFEKVEPIYIEKVEQVTADLTKTELKVLMTALEKVRSHLR